MSEEHTYEYSLTIKNIKHYHNGPGSVVAENILADVTCPFTIFVDDSGIEYITNFIKYQNIIVYFMIKKLLLIIIQIYHRTKEVKAEDFTGKLKTKVETNKNKKDPKDIQASGRRP